MIKKIIHISDLHIRTYSRHDEFRHVAEKFFESIKETVLTEYHPPEVRIVIVGDLVHSKISVTNELSLVLHWFLNECTEICKTIIVAGNHDLLMTNKQRVDTITPIYNLLPNQQNVEYYKESTCYEDENIVWCNYSVFEDNEKPNIDYKITGKKYIGLYHAPIMGAQTDLGYEFQEGTELNQFDGCDAVMMGDIHKRQSFNYKGVPVVYSGSFLQNNFGETVDKHGYLLWDVNTLTYTEHNIESDYGFYKFGVKSIEDLEKGMETLLNE